MGQRTAAGAPAEPAGAGWTLLRPGTEAPGLAVVLAQLKAQAEDLRGGTGGLIPQTYSFLQPLILPCASQKVLLPGTSREAHSHQKLAGRGALTLNTKALAGVSETARVFLESQKEQFAGS